MKSKSYQEILADREKRKRQEIERANKRPPIPRSQGYAFQILIHQIVIDALYEQWRAEVLAKAQATKVVLPPGKPPAKRGGRKNSVLAQLGYD